MIVGKINVPLLELEKRARNLEQFCAYCDSLVPEEFRHIQAIVDNQRYLCCLYLRNSKTLDWKNRQKFMERVMSTCSIVGYATELIEIKSVYDMCNRKRLKDYMIEGAKRK